LVARWEQEDYPAIQALARKAGATIYFGDESAMRSDDHTGTTWAPRGETPVVRAPGRRFSLNMISAIRPRGQVRFMTHTGTCTAAVFRDFLKRLLASSGTPVFLLVDGHAIHKAKLVRDFVAAQEGRLRLFYNRLSTRASDEGSAHFGRWMIGIGAIPRKQHKESCTDRSRIS
jgi:hypothetical protein